MATSDTAKVSRDVDEEAGIMISPVKDMRVRIAVVTPLTEPQSGE